MQIFSLILALSPLRNIALRDRAFRNEYAIDHPQSNVTFPSFCQAHVRGEQQVWNVQQRFLRIL